jgi:hypothetical protein
LELVNRIDWGEKEDIEWVMRFLVIKDSFEAMNIDVPLKLVYEVSRILQGLGWMMVLYGRRLFRSEVGVQAVRSLDITILIDSESFNSCEIVGNSL